MLWESYVSNKAKVTLILHTAHSENDMNMIMSTSIKCCIILNHDSDVCIQRTRDHADINAHFIRSKLASTKFARFVTLNVH